MPKYKVYMRRVITEYAEVLVEAGSEAEAVENAMDEAQDGDVVFDSDFDVDLDITGAVLI